MPDFSDACYTMSATEKHHYPTTDFPCSSNPIKPMSNISTRQAFIESRRLDVPLRTTLMNAHVKLGKVNEDEI